MIQDENLNTGAAYPETIAIMSAVGRLLKREFPALELGIIVQAHDPYAAIAIAQASGADFVRIKVFSGAMLKSEGVRNGIGIEAKNYRTMLDAMRSKSSRTARTGRFSLSSPSRSTSTPCGRSGPEPTRSCSRERITRRRSSI